MNYKWKTLSSLTVEDLQLHPVWRVSNDEQNTSATEYKFLPVNEDSAIIALTEFTLHNGVVMYGFCCPDAYPFDEVQPVIIHSKGHWDLLNDKQAPNFNSDKIFPITYKCLIPFKREYISGKLYN